MRAVIFIILTAFCLVPAGAGSVVAAGSEGQGNPGIRMKGIPGELQWMNTPAEWKDENGSLKISAGAGTDWFFSPFGGDERNNTPRLLFSPEDSFALSTKVKVDFKAAWDAGVLVLYEDDRHWAKLCFEMASGGQPTIVTVVTRGVSDDCNSVPVTGNEVFLKVAKVDRGILFYYSTDGRAWHAVRAFSLGDTQKLRVGFSSQSPQGAGCASTFSEIRYTAGRIRNIWTGE